ncbi:MAG: DUF4292 domain-containing protein [Salinivirgaceae bacterium]|nr:DUF4292 domain-containing protein [Salinivirgaceae bacterium]
MRFRGYLRIIKNEKIWISISPMGVEAARILFTPKEIKFMTRQSNTFFISDYAYFNSKYNIDIDYKTIEQILTNRFIIDNSSENQVVNRTESGLYNVEYTHENKNMTTYQIHPALRKLTSMIFTDFSKKAKLKVHFSDYIDVENQKLPEQINIELEKEGKFHIVELNYKKIIVNSTIKLPFRIPNKFERVWP